MSKTIYTDTRCGESFDKPQAKANHIARHKNQVHISRKLLAVRELAAEKAGHQQ